MSDVLFDEKFFENEGNWNNSEVMRNFVDLIDKPQEQPNLEVEQPELPDVEVAGAESKPPQIKAHLENLKGRLKKLANESVTYGNEKATFEIEKAVEKIDDILFNLNNPGDQ